MTEQQEPKVSVIVPMYKCEPYVDEVLDMLRAQDLREIEIICVIDGSPDRTREMAETHREKDERIRVITQEHGGAGKARNTGLAAARGKYLMFPDADDIFQKNYASAMYEAAEHFNADIVLCLHRQVDSISRVTYERMGYDPTRIPVGKGFKAEDVRNIFTAVTGYAHNKIFRKAFVDSNQLRFSEIGSCNDTFFVFSALCCASAIAAIPDRLYTYRLNVNPASITGNKNPADYLQAYRDLYEWLCRTGALSANTENYIAGWRESLHYQSKFTHNENYVKQTSDEIISAEPWKSMDEKTLHRKLRLDLGEQKAKAALLRLRKSMKKLLNRPDDTGDILLKRQMNEIKNITAIRERLTGKSGNDDILRSLFRTIRDEGPLTFAARLFRKALALLKSG